MRFEFTYRKLSSLIVPRLEKLGVPEMSNSGKSGKAWKTDEYEWLQEYRTDSDLADMFQIFKPASPWHLLSSPAHFSVYNLLRKLRGRSWQSENGKWLQKEGNWRGKRGEIWNEVKLLLPLAELTSNFHKSLPSQILFCPALISNANQNELYSRTIGKSSYKIHYFLFS